MLHLTPSVCLLLPGNEQLARLAGYLHELAGLNDVLHTNHEHLLCESIDKFWLRVGTCFCLHLAWLAAMQHWFMVFLLQCSNRDMQDLQALQALQASLKREEEGH